MAIGLPIRVMGDTTLKNGAEYREELTTGSYDKLISMKG